MKPKPFKPGSSVRVGKLVDKMVSRSFVGKVGTVQSTPRTKRNEGLYVVAFPSGKSDGFWPEELTQA